MTAIASRANRSHRGESVVNDVLVATREELARVGYRALRIDDVATRANVAKTTIYRRWPNKIALVQATLEMMFDFPEVEPDTGSFRGDLLFVAEQAMRFFVSPDGQVLVRMMMAEGAEPELREMVDAMRAEKEIGVERIFDRARARGELRAGITTELLMPILVGGIHHRLFALCAEPATIDVAAHVDLLLYGALVR